MDLSHRHLQRARTVWHLICAGCLVFLDFVLGYLNRITSRKPTKSLHPSLALGLVCCRENDVMLLSIIAHGVDAEALRSTHVHHRHREALERHGFVDGSVVIGVSQGHALRVSVEAPLSPVVPAQKRDHGPHHRIVCVCVPCSMQESSGCAPWHLSRVPRPLACLWSVPSMALGMGSDANDH